MAEFSLHGDQSTLHNRGTAAGAGVEWYQPGAGAYNTAADYSTYQSSGAPAYGSFDDEPPLLEGAMPACKSVASACQPTIGIVTAIPLSAQSIAWQGQCGP